MRCNRNHDSQRDSQIENSFEGRKTLREISPNFVFCHLVFFCFYLFLFVAVFFLFSLRYSHNNQVILTNDKDMHIWLSGYNNFINFYMCKFVPLRDSEQSIWIKLVSLRSLWFFFHNRSVDSGIRPSEVTRHGVFKKQLSLSLPRSIPFDFRGIIL